MILTERAEEILETLWVETEENGRMPDLAVLRNDTAFQELQEQGCLSLQDGPRLTEKGREEGRLCVRRHRLAERLFADVLNVKSALVHEASCQLEHILHKGLEDNICILLGHPQTCPHGKPIPNGPCCRERRRKFESVVMPLSEMKKGQKGKIAYIQTNDREMLKRIMAMGALPGSAVTLLLHFPAPVFQIGASQFAIDKEMADKIRVWVRDKD
jgi:DtxR family Mn-dependent transcriptional regulator